MESFDHSESYTESKGWPPIIWLILKILGTFYHRRIVGERRCFSCHMDHCEQRYKVTENPNDGLRNLCPNETFNVTSNYEVGDGEMEASSGTRRTKSCGACEACWWDHNGNVHRYTDGTIGVQPWNHRGSCLFSVLFLVAAIGLLVYQFWITLQRMFGRPELLLHFLSYTSFLCMLSVVPALVLCSKLSSALCGRGFGYWSVTLNPRFIVQRIQYIPMEMNGLPGKLFLVLCFVWPVTCSVYRAYILISLQGMQGYSTALACLFPAVTEIMWGGFIYLIFLMRKSFQIQLDLVTRFLITQEGETELTQKLLRQVTVDFKCFRNCVSVYTTLSIPIIILGITTNLTWQYILHSIENDRTDYQTYVQRNINAMIWTEIVMFATLAPIAIGGPDANHIWDRFRRNVTCMQRMEQQRYWTEVTRYIKDVAETLPTISFTMVLSVVGIYMAMQFSEQDVFY